MQAIENVKSHIYFYKTIGSLNLGALCVGLAVGWPSPSFLYLYNRIGSPTVAYLDEAWIESAINVGASLGSLLSIFISDFYGRRISFSLSAAILTGFWLFLASSGSDKVLIISAAGVAGFGAGLFVPTAVLYVAEISSAKNRGIVGAAVIMFGYLGVFAMNLSGYLFEMTFILSIMVTLPLSFLVTIYFWMIESPFHLFQKGMVLQSKISLMHLRDRRSVLEVDEEFKSMQAFFNLNVTKKPGQLLLESMCPKSFRPMTLVFMPVLCISQMLGVTAISDYAEHLIETIYPATGKLVTSFIDVVSIVFCLFAIERFGRKPLLAFTIIGSALCCLILAIYYYVGEDECHTKMLFVDHRVFPVTMICLYYTVYALGLTPVLPIVTGEIFPSQAKTAAVGICTCLLYLIAFCTQRSYDALNKNTSSCLAFVCFSVLGSIGLPFAMILMPETKGKSLLQIQNELENIIITNY